MEPITHDTPITFEPIDPPAMPLDFVNWLSKQFPNSIAAIAGLAEPSPLPTIEW